MRIISNDGSLKNWAKKIESEIISYPDEWFWPKDDKHKVFEQAKMIFVNRNLNYFSINNMITAVCEGDEYNSKLTMTRKFCGYTRTLTGDTGPFGRMCVWNLQSDKALLPHVDAFDYHFNIIRNIFVVSEHANNEITVSIGEKKIDCEQGTLFQFSPATERHAFRNAGNSPFYFLGYDFWIPERLNMLIQDSETVDEFMHDHDRLTKFNNPKTSIQKYISSH